MTSFSADGPRVQRLLARLQQSHEAYLGSDGLVYSRGYLDGLAHAMHTVREELDTNIVATLGGPPSTPQREIPTAVLDAAAAHGLDVQSLLDCLDCEHEMEQVDWPDGGVSRKCELCGSEEDFLREADLPFNPATPCLICGDRGGDGTRVDHEGDEIPCYECATN